MIIQNNKKSLITYENGIVKKRNKTSIVTLDNKWFKAYRKLSKNNEFLVKVYDVSNNVVSMEYVEIIDSIENVFKNYKLKKKLNKYIICDIIKAVNYTWMLSIDYSRHLPDNKYFINCDLSLSNIVLTKDLKVKIIDPESFTFVENLEYAESYYMTQINLMYKIQKHFYSNDNT